MYVKTQWVNNTTPINDTNLNKIEQGIYDNSLVVDAVTNTLNPTDTETYKTAELTEGQITDVIGVSDIILKGDTVQDGTPTPSSPVDVNVVSGSNVINTSNKNLFDKNNVEDGKYINANGTISASVNYVTTDFIRVYSGNKYYLPKTYTRRLKYFNSNKEVLSTSDWDISSGNTAQVLTIPDNAYYVRFSIDKTQINLNTFQFEQGSTATTYEPHQDKELPLDLGSIELCKIGTYQDYFYRDNNKGKWYLHKETGKFFSDKQSDWTSDNNGRYFRAIDNIVLAPNNNTVGTGKCNVGLVTANQTIPGDGFKAGLAIHSTVNRLYISSDVYGNITTTPTLLYYAYITPTNTEITNTTLISQLEAIYNAPLYEETNITQTNNDLPMVLDITACKDNINGIKAFIRK